ncbi:MAG TPA: DUF1059 domain-containing protein [Chitinophagaceae bacterium]
MKQLRCSDAGFDCDKIITAATEEEVLNEAAAHARNDHHVTVTPEMVSQIKMLITDEEEVPH